MGLICARNALLVVILLLIEWNQRILIRSTNSGDFHYYPFRGDPMFPYSLNSHKEESWEEDEFWWEGAEEVDLTVSFWPFEEETASAKTKNDTCSWTTDCNEIVAMSHPPNIAKKIPPPPMPPFLSGFEGIMEDSDTRWASLSGDDGVIATEFTDSEGVLMGAISRWSNSRGKEQCSRCRWAMGGNETLFMFPRIRDDVTMNESMAGILVGVALVSAVIGASIMGVLLRCKKKRNETDDEGASALHMLRICNSWKKETTNNQSEREITSREERNKNVIPSCRPHRTRWTLKFWPKTSSEAKLNATSSPENSYSEEPYVNADANSALYTELSGPNVVSSADFINTKGPNTYSEIPDPVRSKQEIECLKNCGQRCAYENSVYSTSEFPSDQNESSPGSTSAYYSDASALDLQNSKKRKKKRKGEERINACKFSSPAVLGQALPSGVPLLCSHVPFHPVHLNVGPVQTQYLPVQETLPLRVALLPNHSGFNGRDLELGVPGLLYHTQSIVPNIKEINTLSNARPVPNLRSYCDRNVCNEIISQEKRCMHGIHSVGGSPGLPSVSNVHNNSQCHENIMLQRAFCQEPHRPLPPLPSHMILSAQNKALKAHFEQNEFPSEYV